MIAKFLVKPYFWTPFVRKLKQVYMAKKPKENDWKDRLNVVYSTNPDFKYELDDEEEQPLSNRPNNVCAYNWTARTGAVKL